jgi:hypothetical protein
MRGKITIGVIDRDRNTIVPIRNWTDKKGVLN